MLSSEDLRRFRQRLEAERDAIQARISENDRGVQETVRDDIGVGDQEDEAEVIYEREADLDATARDQDELVRVNDALSRIEHGTYGVSEVSGKPIPIERLEALPYATTLVGERLPESD